MIERLYIDNYRCFSNFEVTLGSSTLLVGRNGCGKSSLWEVLAGLQDMVAHGRAAEEAFPEHCRTRWDTRREQTFELSATVDGVRYEYRWVVSHYEGTRGRGATLLEERVVGNGVSLYQRASDGMVELFGNDPGGNQPRTRIPFDTGRSFLPALQDRPDNTLLRQFRTFVENIQLLSINGSGMESESRGEVTRLARDAKNFVSWLSARVLDDPSIAEKMSRDLREAVPGFQSLRFERVGRQGRELVIDVRPHGKGRSFGLGFGELSDGERVLLVAYGLLHGVSANTFLFLDEPDNFLALTEIQPWLSKLREDLPERGAQLLLASHQSETIDYLAADEVIVLNRPGGGPVRAGGLEFDLESGVSTSEWLASAERHSLPEQDPTVIERES